MSIGFFLEENAAVVWRGPMLHKAIQQFLEDVDWGELDYLLLDLPPGTGDVSMTLAQLLPQAKILIVTTPQPAAQSVARRAAEMAEKVDLELLGVIENMSGFTAPTASASRSSARAAASSSPTSSTSRCSGRCRSRRSFASTRTRARRWSSSSPNAPAAQAIRRRRARHRGRDAAGASGDAGATAGRDGGAAPVSGTELPVVQR